MKKTYLYSWLHSNAIEFDSAVTAQAVLLAAKAVGHPVMSFAKMTKGRIVLWSKTMGAVVNSPETVLLEQPRHKAADVFEIILALLSPPVEEPRKIKRVAAMDLKPGDRFRIAGTTVSDDYLREQKPFFIAADFGNGMERFSLEDYEKDCIDMLVLPRSRVTCALYHKDGTPVYEGDDE